MVSVLASESPPSMRIGPAVPPALRGSRSRLNVSLPARPRNTTFVKVLTGVTVDVMV